MAILVNQLMFHTWDVEPEIRMDQSELSQLREIELSVRMPE